MAPQNLDLFDDADPADQVRAVEREWEDLAGHPVLAAHMAARDGLELHGYLTAPPDGGTGPRNRAPRRGGSGRTAAHE